MPPSSIPVVALNDGTSIPQLGFGVFRVPDEEAMAAVAAALDAGYRAIDTAAYYRNERGTGAAIAGSGIPRGELHVTTKVWHTDLGFDSTMRAVDASLANLGVDYLDLYLIHWPVPSRGLYVDTWRALEKIKSDGLARSIGVSNFPPEVVERLLAETDTVPAVNQVELHPWLPQTELREFNSRHGIATQAWSPLAHGRLVDDPTVAGVAERHGRTPAQVLLRWNLELGNLVVSKSVTPERIRSNTDVFSFELSAGDHAVLASLESGVRTGPDPNVYGA
ncbi:aldo/keto reductase [Nocardia donostiensis]|uniref:Oxidoreductase n=1 Tax=Nocardia donostiensis TaxID=1538463 RepID=A0A1W0AUF1_9NOCA|nr:aldo/keto reductase [Nocardia donostiensis]ONM48138.1 oxidoreductase [Nocardia donostiensis]OQS13873.1 oxidoreductase [Nocardia donostiensis]OQS20367.1 oxidoreductase [Nocardia donostiensis]